MADRANITPESCRQLLRYEPETGKLFWRRNGKPAIDCLDDKGYRKGMLCGRYVRAHRVAWCIHYGRWPVSEIDHLNGARSDNRIANLRECSTSINQRNARTRVDSASGVTGVYWIPRGRKWSAAINIGKRIHLGYFKRLEDAVAARRKAELKHDFRPLGAR